MSRDDDLIKVTVNMPKIYHRRLKAIAAIKGIGLSTYIMECIEKANLRQKEETSEEHLEEDAIKEVEELIKAQS